MSKKKSPTSSTKRGFFSAIFAMLSGNLAASMLMGIAVIGLPKLVAIELFGQWQLYVLWVTYLGYLTFGLAEGFFVRFSGRQIDDVPKGLEISQLIVTVLLLYSALALLFFGTLIATDDPVTRQIIGFASLTTAVYVPRVYLAYVFQTFNKMWPYARSVMLERSVFVVIAFTVAINGEPTLWQILLADTFGRLIGLIYMALLAFKESFAPPSWDGNIRRETKLTIQAGIALNISALSAVLITTIPRFAVNSSFSIVTFAQVAFVFTFLGLFQTVASALSTATLPSLRQAGDGNYRNLYQKSSAIISLTLSQTYLLIFVAVWFVKFWLPEQTLLPSLVLIMFSFVAFETRSRILSTPFLQAVREEKYLMWINLVSLIFSVVLVLLAVRLGLSVKVLVAVLPASVMVRAALLRTRTQKIFESRRNIDFSLDVFAFVLLLLAGFEITGLPWQVWVLITWCITSIGNALNFMNMSSRNKWEHEQALDDQNGGASVVKTIVLRSFALLTVAAVAMAFLFTFFSSRKVPTANKPEIYTALNNLETSGEISEIDFPLSANPHFDPVMSYVLSGSKVYAFQNGQLEPWWDLPTGLDDSNVAELFNGVAFFQNSDRSLKQAVYLPEKRLIPFPTGPFVTRPLGIAPGGVTVLSLEANLQNVSKVIGIDTNGRKQWEFVGSCSSSAEREPALLWLYDCQNLQTDRQESGWILNARTGHADSIGLRKGEQIKTINGELFVVSEDRSTAYRVKDNAKVGTGFDVPEGVLDELTKAPGVHPRWQSDSLEVAVSAGLSSGWMHNHVVLGNGEAVKIPFKSCINPIFLNGGSLYMCGLNGNLSFRDGLTIHDTQTGSTLEQLTGVGRIVQLNGSIVGTLTSSTGSKLFSFKQ